MLFLKGSTDPLFFLFRKGNFALSPSTKLHTCISVTLQPLIKKLLDYGDVHVQSPSIVVSKVADATSYNAVADPGEWPGPPPPLFVHQNEPKGLEKIFWETGPPLISGYG